MKMNKQVLSLGMIALLVITSTSAFAASGKDELASSITQDAIAVQAEAQVSTAEAVIFASATVPAASLVSNAEAVTMEMVINPNQGDTTDMAIASMTTAINIPATDLSQISEAVQINISEEGSAAVESSEIAATATIAATLLDQNDVTVERQ